jgi:hypothetical protein
MSIIHNTHNRCPQLIILFGIMIVFVVGMTFDLIGNSDAFAMHYVQTNNHGYVYSDLVYRQSDPQLIYTSL